MGTPVLVKGCLAACKPFLLLKDLSVNFFWIFPITVFGKSVLMIQSWILYLNLVPVFPPLPQPPPAWPLPLSISTSDRRGVGNGGGQIQCCSHQLYGDRRGTDSWLKEDPSINCDSPFVHIGTQDSCRQGTDDEIWEVWGQIKPTQVHTHFSFYKALEQKHSVISL